MNKQKKGVNRREFLGSTVKAGAVGAFTAGMLLASCSSKKTAEELGLPPLLDKAPDGKKLKAGLIGAGHRGTGAALNFISAGPNLEVVALADVFQDRIDDCRKKLKEKGVEVADNMCFTGFDAYEQLLGKDLDVVILATPPYFRPQQFAAAIKARKHVFMEKPVAVDPTGIRSVLATAEKAKAMGLNVVTGTQRRHRRDYVATYEQIANGAIGEILAAKAYWNQSHVWYRERKEGWSDMEYMIRNWNNFCWLSGDHIVEQHVHNIDVINWFTGKTPVFAIGYGGRARRKTGDQYDFFSIDFNYGGGLSMHSMCRQIDSCANGIGEFIIGTKGMSNCSNKIFNLEGKLIWSYEYPENDQGESTGKVKVSPYVQEHIHLVTAIRTGNYVNYARDTALSTLTGIMGRVSAYTGKKITWDVMMKSDMKLGPEKIEMGDVDMEFKVPVPGTPPA